MSRIPFLLGLLLVTLVLTARPAWAQNDVEVTLDRFGVGSVYRQGAVVGIRLQLEVALDSGLEEATSVWVQWEVPNADGDLGGYGRALTLTRRRPTRVWLYALLDPATERGTAWSIRVFEYRDGSRGRELGGGRISAPSPNHVDIRTALIGVVGSVQMGLDQFAIKQGPDGAAIITAHETTRIAAGIRPEDLPDRWYGLEPFEAIAWAGELPQDLPSAQASALREWVRRGGHLIISLPEDTNPWGLGESGQTDLDDLLPASAPRKDEDVSLRSLLPVLSKSRGLGTDFPVSLRVFADQLKGFDAIDREYEPLIALPDGRVIVIQRLFGHGRVTLVGLDLGNRRLASLPLPNNQLSGLPQADVFWNRILGRRADTPLAGELIAIDRAERLTRSSPRQADIGTGELLRREINMSRAATTGLLVAFVLFLGYWVVGGPGGFAALKHYKRVKHAWLAFAGTAGVFTALAWGAVAGLREHDIQVRHVTVLDHIARPGERTWDEHDPQLQRASAWLSVYLPGYADTRVEIESMGEDGSVPAQHDLLMSWTPPGQAVQKFPNVDRYTVDVARSPGGYALPARSTATQLYARWLGGIDPSWGGLIREDPADPIRVDTDGREWVLKGSIVNELPGDLENVTLIWIRNERFPNRAYALDAGREAAWIENRSTGRMLNSGRMVRLAGPWPSGESRKIAFGNTRQFLLDPNIYERYVKREEKTTTAALTHDTRQGMEMLTLFSQLTAPKYLRDRPRGTNPETMMAVRMLGRELDLGPWFNRPCLIVMGFIQEASCPIPLKVEGAPVDADGLTMVRWVFPLSIDMTRAFREAAATPEPVGPGD